MQKSLFHHQWQTLDQSTQPNTGGTIGCTCTYKIILINWQLFGISIIIITFLQCPICEKWISRSTDVCIQKLPNYYMYIPSFANGSLSPYLETLFKVCLNIVSYILHTLRIQVSRSLVESWDMLLWSDTNDSIRLRMFLSAVKDRK